MDTSTASPSVPTQPVAKTPSVKKTGVTKKRGKNHGIKVPKWRGLSGGFKNSGLAIHPNRFHRVFSKKYPQKVNPKASIYAAAVAEYMLAEMIELSGRAARDNRKLKIVPRHIMLAIRADEELDKFLKDVTFPWAGVVPREYVENVKKNGGLREPDEIQLSRPEDNWKTVKANMGFPGFKKKEPRPAIRELSEEV